MRVVRTLMLLALVPSLAHAQVLNTHGAPDRSVYNSGGEWPTDSFQCHWAATGASGHSDMIDVLGFNPNNTLGMPAHIHINLHHPRYADLSQTWQVDFTILAFHFDGFIAGPWGSLFKAATAADYAHDWFFDDTQSSTAPGMQGDPLGIKQWTGHFSIEPRANFHGFDVVEMAVEAHFTNHDIMDVEALESYFNNVDPDAPITIGSQGPADRPFMGTICSPFVFNDESVFGSNEMFVDDFLPTTPVNGKWETTTEIEPYRTQVGSPTAFTNSYGGSSLLSTIGSYQTRHDQDFHNGKPGVIVSEVDSTGIIPAAIKIDNSGLPVGAHPWAMIRFQPEKLNPQNGVASLLVIQVPNTTAVAPPPPPSVPPPSPVPPPSSSPPASSPPPPPPPPSQELPTIPSLN